MSLLPRLVSGWYWWYALPSANCVDGDVDDALARALGDQVHEAEQILVGVAEAHAAADARSRSSEALRDMLKVTMHWYWFQMLTMRLSFSSVGLDRVARRAAASSAS